MRVMTVLGAVDPDELGITLPHEHIILDAQRHTIFGIDAVLDDVDLAVDELRCVREAGGGTVVDVTNGTIGRNVQAQLRVARETGLHVVASTGYYIEPYYPPEVFRLSADRLADRMVDELTKGIDGTEVRAGIIGEIGTRRDFISPAEERVFRAAARAHLRTGAPITTHTYLEELALEQLDILEDEGVDPHRVIIGHLGDRRDMPRLRSIAARGVFLEIDHVGMWFYQRDEQRARTVAQLIREGYLSQILLSQDVCFKRLLHWFGGGGYDRLLTGFLPLLMAEGVTKQEIHTMLVENPRRALAFEV
ncbi:MAG: phosphotriesterase-related protein [Chloroflexi bacterium]|nr:phosphotriesterase-related protein [Chloroflexota bacterium]